MPVSLSALPAPVRVAPSRLALAHRLDVRAIREACEILGIAGEVVISHARYKRGTLGGLYKFANGRHTITLGCRLTPGQASATLWHELTHAKQECEGRRSEGTLSLMRTAYADYLAHPLEVEARANEPLALEHPLATYPHGTWEADALTYPLTA